MKRRYLMLAAILSSFSSGSLSAQTWLGVLDPSRALDWTRAGVVGGIPSETWTQCGSTIAAGASAAAINSAIRRCPEGQYVQLGSGIFALATGLAMKSGVVLRGMGADQTMLVFRGVNACSGARAAICFAGGNSSDYFTDAKMQPGGSNAAVWTSGYAKGETQIVLSSIGSTGVSVGQYIHLDQAEDTATNDGLFVCENTSAIPPCSIEGGAGNPGRVIGGIARQQVQIVKVMGCKPSCTNGATFSISPGLYAPNYSEGKSPGAWWTTVRITNSGLEDLSVDATDSGGRANVAIWNADNIWVRGTRQIRSCQCNRSIIQMLAATHVTVQDNYFYGTTGKSQNYGVESYIVSDALIMNNIFQHVVSPMMLHSNTGSVYIYNFAINNTYDDGRSPQYHWMSYAISNHSAGVMYNLFEGNVGPGLGADSFHGNQVMNTVFRNYWKGSDANRIDATYAVNIENWNRYWNIVGNVLGTPGYTVRYNGASPAIYALGVARPGIPADPRVATTMMRWGNYDTVNASVRWDSGEVPTTVSPYGNAIPRSKTLPASMYFNSRPNWWPLGRAWPPIGPDVTGGNVDGLGGHVYTLPAQDCYLNGMRGPADGIGSVLSFNASACYRSSSDSTSAPLGRQ